MSDDQITWIAWACVEYDALLFVIVGRFGSQPLLMPRSLYARATLTRD